MESTPATQECVNIERHQSELIEYVNIIWNKTCSFQQMQKRHLTKSDILLHISLQQSRNGRKLTIGWRHLQNATADMMLNVEG